MVNSLQMEIRLTSALHIAAYWRTWGWAAVLFLWSSSASLGGVSIYLSHFMFDFNSVDFCPMTFYFPRPVSLLLRLSNAPHRHRHRPLWPVSACLHSCVIASLFHSPETNRIYAARLLQCYHATVLLSLTLAPPCVTSLGDVYMCLLCLSVCLSCLHAPSPISISFPDISIYSDLLHVAFPYYESTRLFDFALLQPLHLLIFSLNLFSSYCYLHLITLLFS